MVYFIFASLIFSVLIIRQGYQSVGTPFSKHPVRYRYQTDEAATTRQRRYFLQHHASVASSLLLPTWVHARDYADLGSSSNRLLCDRGSLMTESVVPGAYQSACMILDSRKVPLLTKTTGSKVDTGSNGLTISRILTIQQGAVGAGKTGVAIWNSGLLLLRLLNCLTLESDDWLSSSKTVLELGCGTGLCSIGLSLLAGSELRVIATDGNPAVVDLAQKNVEANTEDANRPNLRVSQLQWGLFDAMDFSDTTDWVIGSDLTYNSGTWRVLAETVETVLKPNGVFLYLSLGHSGFPVEAEIQGFLQVCNGLEIISDGKTVGLPVSDLNKLLLSKCIYPEERRILDGGARVLLLRKTTR